MNFGLAIDLMKKGCKLAREGWNGKGMFIYLQKGDNFTNDHINMKTQDGSICTGWLASQQDMLEEDWVIVE